MYVMQVSLYTHLHSRWWSLVRFSPNHVHLERTEDRTTGLSPRTGLNGTGPMVRSDGSEVRSTVQDRTAATLFLSPAQHLQGLGGWAGFTKEERDNAKGWILNALKVRALPRPVSFSP